MKENRDCPFVGSVQSFIMLNFDCAGALPSFIISTPTYSTRSFRNSHLSNLKLTRYFLKMMHTHSKYRRIRALLLQYKIISSMIVRLPETIFLVPTKISFASVTMTISLPIIKSAFTLIIKRTSHSSLSLFIIAV